MTDDELAAIEARAAAASPMPWRYQRDKKSRNFVRHEWVSGPVIDMDAAIEGDYFTRDLRFIAHARQDVPALVAEVRRLRALLPPEAP